MSAMSSLPCPDPPPPPPTLGLETGHTGHQNRTLNLQMAAPTTHTEHLSPHHSHQQPQSTLDLRLAVTHPPMRTHLQPPPVTSDQHVPNGETGNCHVDESLPPMEQHQIPMQSQTPPPLQHHNALHSQPPTGPSNPHYLDGKQTSHRTVSPHSPRHLTGFWHGLWVWSFCTGVMASLGV